MSMGLFTVLIFVGIFIGVFMGFPIAFTLAGLGAVFGFIGWGDAIIPLMASKSFAVMQNYTYVSIPLFIFMGAMLDKSGVADKAFAVLNYWLRNIKGGLAIATIILCTIFAACTGVVGASVTAMGLLALPPMIKRGYNHALATGVVASGGTLGILIPPSIMLVLYGPMANISVVDLFSSAIVPGLMLAAGYLAYVIVFVHVKKDAIVTPPDYEGDNEVYTIMDGVKAFVPFMFIIFMVLGLILFGVCSPTEASAAGAFGAIILAAAYKKINLKVMFDSGKSTLATSAMVMFVAVGANIFTSVFFGCGCDRVMTNFVMNLGFGMWGTLIAVLILVFILGMLIDWIGILLIVVPIFLPIMAEYGIDTLWASMLIIVMLQSSFLTPPFAYALFYIKGIAPKGVTIGSIYKGVIPFICIIFIVLGLLMMFPGIVHFLPNLMKSLQG
ncbi:MAG: TRAP transporter large permease subunit [Firmicutes bacterium]|nr:TRAP transporter large permease subunit [Bacillota bacterium]